MFNGKNLLLLVLAYAEGLLFGAALLIFSKAIAADLTGEIEPADQRPLQTGDLFPLGVSLFGLYCFISGTAQIGRIIASLLGAVNFSRGDTLVDIGAGVLLSLFGFILAFHTGIRRRLGR